MVTTVSIPFLQLASRFFFKTSFSSDILVPSGFQVFYLQTKESDTMSETTH